MNFHVVIPARYDSTRLPGKVLLEIAGQPMIQHVHEKAVLSGAESITIATDDERVAEAAEAFGANVCMTSPDHPSGTERICEAVEAMELDDDEVVIGLQADEPLMPHAVIRSLAEDLIEHDNIHVASVCSPLLSVDDLFNPNIVKVVLNRRQYAMYFSRAPIPWDRESFADPSKAQLTEMHYQHLGLYGYRVNFLRKYVDWSASPLETCESLEQLRILWHGGRMHMVVNTSAVSHGVDTQEQYEKMLKLIKHPVKSL